MEVHENLKSSMEFKKNEENHVVHRKFIGAETAYRNSGSSVDLININGTQEGHLEFWGSNWTGSSMELRQFTGT